MWKSHIIELYNCQNRLKPLGQPVYLPKLDGLSYNSLNLFKSTYF